MASSIDTSKPDAISATTESVRNNFSTAASEISALQNQTQNLDSSGNFSDGTIDNSIIGGSAPAAGAFTETDTDNLNFPSFAQSLASAADVVATYIYDTTQDSDGGAWRERCAWTSWEQETLGTATRGVTRKFPVVALIVARAGSLTIYDAHDIDPATGKPRMWMVFNGGINNLAYNGDSSVPSSVFAINGNLYASITNATSNGGLLLVKFPLDFGGILQNTITELNHKSSISLRNDGVRVGRPTASTLLSRVCNAVHAAVLPGAPLDAAGLPIPTVAVATAAGTSVIHPDGRVVDITVANGYSACRILAGGRLWLARGNTATVVDYGPLPYADAANSAWRQGVYADTVGTPRLLPAAFNTFTGVATDAVFSGSGLTHLAEDRTNPANGMVSYSAINYATGWQPGAIKGAWLCDGVTGNITAANVLNDDCSSTTGWTLGSGWAHDTTEFDHSTGTAALDRALSGLTVGQTYMLTVTTGNRSAGTLTVSLPSGGTLGGQTAITTDGVAILQIIASATTGTLRFTPTTDFDGSVQDVQIDLAGADRSFNGLPARQEGTLTSTAVATGADLTALSDFTATDYREVPYSPLLDFGDADFAIIGWIKEAPNSATETILERDSVTTAARFTIQISAAGLLQFITDDGTDVVTSATTAAIDDSTWHGFVCVMRGNTQEVWIDGILADSDDASAVGSLSNAAAILRIGATCASTPGSPLTNGSVALLRATAYAPTPRQIRQMYEDEKALFQAGAKAFLGGTSNNVQGLSRDPVIDQLAVATADGVAVFDGPQRTAYYDSTNLSGAMTSDNAKAVSMNRGALLIGTAAEAGIYSPALPGRDAIIGHNGGPPLDDSKGAADMEGVTTDATPLVLAPRISVGERELVRGWALVMGRMYGASATERFSTVLEFTAYRDAGGNVTLSIAADDQHGARWDTTGAAAIVTTVETTGTMDAAVVVDTTAQTIGVQVTGVAATRIAWLAKVEWTRITEDQRYAQ